MTRTQIIVLFSAIVLFGVVLELVRRRQLREEYSWLWLTAAFFYLVMAVVPNLANLLSGLLGTTNTITAFIFVGLLFIILILIHYSVRLSKLTTQIKDLAQHLAILDGEQYKVNQLSGNESQEVNQDQDHQLPEEENPFQQSKLGNQEAGKLSQSLE